MSNPDPIQPKPNPRREVLAFLRQVADTECGQPIAWLFRYWPE